MCVCACVYLYVCVLGVELAMIKRNKAKCLLCGILKCNKGDNHAHH